MLAISLILIGTIVIGGILGVFLIAWAALLFAVGIIAYTIKRAYNWLRGRFS